MSDTDDTVNIRVVRSGRRHKVGNQRIIEAMAAAGKPAVIGDQLQYVGVDARGVELGIVAVPDDRDRVASRSSKRCPPAFAEKESDRS